MSTRAKATDRRAVAQPPGGVDFVTDDNAEPGDYITVLAALLIRLDRARQAETEQKVSGEGPPKAP